MKAFALFALLPFVAAMPSHPAPAYGGYQPAPAYGHPAPAYGHPAPAYGHPAPAYGHAPAPAYGHQAGYGYEQPKHNCSVLDVTEKAQVCTPTIATTCANVELAIKIIISVEQCYPVVRTLCTESIEVIPNEVCTYSYEPQDEATIAKTVEVTFKKESKTQMVTVCQPGGGYGGGYGHGGYGGYGHQYCNEVAQETQYNVPVVTAVDVDVTVTYPKPVKTCVEKPISLPRVTCANIEVEKCIQVPEVEDSSVSVAKCVAGLGAPECIDVELTLPKQVCVELVYGYAHEHKEHPTHAPAYAPAPAAASY
jgi:hypothetical protein